jgi:hypothetical protein
MNKQLSAALDRYLTTPPEDYSEDEDEFLCGMCEQCFAQDWCELKKRFYEGENCQTEMMKNCIVIKSHVNLVRETAAMCELMMERGQFSAFLKELPNNQVGFTTYGVAINTGDRVLDYEYADTYVSLNGGKIVIFPEGLHIIADGETYGVLSNI